MPYDYKPRQPESWDLCLLAAALAVVITIAGACWMADLWGMIR